jgi:hypothetical protein
MSRSKLTLFCVLVGLVGAICAVGDVDDGDDTPSSVAFHRIKTCQECVESGFGWCPIRRACGGFQNRNCIGDNDERDFARTRVEVVTDFDMEFPPFTALNLHRVFFVYDSSSTDKALIDEFENAAIDCEQLNGGGGAGGPVFMSVDVHRNKQLGDVLNPDGSHALPTLLVFRKVAPGSDTTATTAAPDASYSGPWTSDAMLEFVQSVSSARIPELDLKVKDFVESMLQSMAGGPAADVAIADMKLIIEDVREFAAGASAVQVGLTEIYVATMERIVEDPMFAMAWLSTRVNNLNANGAATDELDILKAFTSQMLG